MLKRKVQLLKKELEKITKSKTRDVFVVSRNGDQYTVISNGTIIFKGKKDEFETYKENHEGGIWVITNIPRPVPLESN